MNWIWKGRDDVIFETADDKKRKEKIRNVKRFALAAVVLLVIAVVLILKQYNFNLSAALGRGDEKKAQTTFEAEKEEIQKSYYAEQETLLFYCSDDDKSSLYFLIMMSVDLSDDTVNIHPVDVNADILPYRDFSGDIVGSASHCFSIGGSSMLVEACENYLGKPIDKFFGTTESDFANIIVNFPNIKVDLESDLRLSNGTDSIYLNKGIQEISDINLLKYLTYGGRSSTEELLSDQAKAAAAALTAFINESIVENIDVVFDRIINLSQSNVSVFDLKNHVGSLEYIAKYGSEFEYNTMLSKEDFSESLD